ncbi:TetR/AcrR family transcriptional regulator [Ktedonosporobacter rubrisoli]|uniref:TetR/AcrR family transcriptional regulator n=1 Tax=Ktedonosporobacter rubrisoli TaxID=2509675 RepID=A0A4P6JJF5_KTERU|nr:TetR/AcrR family transcriptional regulator [Ktedonosporobacter rubrisoli]QBD74796.1 TetR/AcrR family transcriptional regulator [Ktedonosporobacter rubrisoli]
MPRSEAANQRIREERREHILDASALVFARKGLAATKIADIAEASNISQGLIYRYFVNKEEIFTALIERALDATASIAQAALKQSGSPLAKLHWLLENFFSGMWEQPEYAQMIMQALSSDTTPEEVNMLVAKHISPIIKAFYHLIVEGQACGEIIADDASMLTFMVLSCLQGTIRGMLHQELLPKPVGPPNPEIIIRMLKA